MKIYKYFSDEVMPLVFSKEDICSVKCSRPKDYNDPFELFLGVDFGVSTESLATYREIIQEIPQLPTTCFSKSPCVSAMWAHYGKNHSGFVLEFDKERLEQSFDDIAIRDVEYKDQPNPKLAHFTQMAARRMKPRDALWLTQTVLHEAYFSKYLEWSYEQECRLIDFGKNVETASGLDILDIPLDCVTAMIVGRNSSPEFVEKSQLLADKQGVHFYQICIGKSLPKPYFRTLDGRIFLFEDEEIKEATFTCDNCEEPISDDRQSCAWCAITEEDAELAARTNPFRILDHFGQLDNYLRGPAKTK